MADPMPNHCALATNNPAIAQPYSRLSAYTGLPNRSNNSVDPMETNRGFTKPITSTTGSCQRRDNAAAHHPRTQAPYANPPANESAISSGCMENIVRPSVTARYAAGTAGCRVSKAVCRIERAVRPPPYPYGNCTRIARRVRRALPHCGIIDLSARRARRNLQPILGSLVWMLPRL